MFSITSKSLSQIVTKKYTPTILMSDHDSTFMSPQFQQILRDKDVMHQSNIINDHHALGLIDSFTR